MSIYPWQFASKMLRLQLTEVILHSLDLDTLQRELASVELKFKNSPQTGPHHNQKWSRLGLIGPGGDPHRSYGRLSEASAKTPVLTLMPSIERLLDGIGPEVRSAIISRMEPGAVVRWHRDPEQTADHSLIRLHLPIVTSPKSTLELGHQRLHLTAGYLWYSDFSFPHRVFNRSNMPRTHIMFDIRVNAESRALLSSRWHYETERRKVARKISAQVFDLSEKLHSEGRYATRFRKARDEAKRRGETFRPESVGTSHSQSAPE